MLIVKTFTAIVPLKLNSERVPNKNFRLLDGKPLYQYIIQTLHEVDFIDEIIINTDVDSDKFLEFDLMESPKITHSNRPLSLCGDLISMNSIIQYELERSSKDAFVMTHATNPLLTAQTISNMIQTFLEQNAEYDSLMKIGRAHV